MAAVLQQTNSTATPEATKAGWRSDPEGEHKLRYFDGSNWTDHVTHYGPTPCSGCAEERS